MAILDLQARDSAAKGWVSDVRRQPVVTYRAIPGSGEPLPMVGCGTYRAFDVSETSRRYPELGEVVDTLLSVRNSMIDSSPMYGLAEQTAGALLADRDRRPEAFIATKVWTKGRKAGAKQIERSFAHFRTDRIDLIQVHNLLDYKVHLETLRDLKRTDRLRYIGVTHYHSGAFADLERVIRDEPIDFVQLNYSLEDRLAEARLLPLALEKGVAVIVNVPFGGGDMVRRLAGRPLPGFAADIGCTSWSQLLLKFVLGHPAVTCAIPGTGNPAHMAANMAAAGGDLADARDRLLAWWHDH